MTRIALVLALLSLLVPAGTLAGSHARTAPRDTSIFYYPWYGTPKFDGSYLHWDQNGHVPPLDLASSYYPARGPYSSGDPKVVAAQMRDIAGAGIKEIVSSWWGWGSIEDQRLPMIVRMARSQGLEVAAQIEPYVGRTSQSVAADFAHLHQLGITRFYVYHPFTIDEADWAPVLQSASGIQVLGQTANVTRAVAAHFAGIYTYDIATFGPATFGPLCARAHKAGLLCAPSVGPGYDALRANGDTRIRERNGGATYDAMWTAAIQSGADRVTITSYNEWHEGTQIEAAMTPVSRRLTIADRPATTPVTHPYLSYDGAYGLHGESASKAYLVRTAYWTTRYRSSATPAPPSKKAEEGTAHGRKEGRRPESGRMATLTYGPAASASSALDARPHAAFACSTTNLLLKALQSRLLAAVRGTGSEMVVRPLRCGALSMRAAARRSCYRARRPHTLLGMSVITRCGSSSEGSRSSVPDVLPAGQVRIGGQLAVSKGG